MIGILDYGLGNIASISNSLNKISKENFFVGKPSLTNSRDLS